MVADKGPRSGAGRVLAIIPAYDEAGNVAAVVAGVRQAAPDVDVLVVDDGSRDDTAAVSRRAGARVVSHAFNLGYGVALQTGFKYGLVGGYDYAVHLDGDGQHDPAAVPDILRLLRDDIADAVIGSRYLAAPPAWTGPFRRFGSWLLAGLTSSIIGQRITDPTSGYQGCNRRVMQFYAQDIYPVDYPDADVVIMLHRAGFHICETPVTMHRRARGRSMHDGVRVAYYVYKMLLAIGLTLLRDDRPVAWDGL
jgi:glycosyltransferase involved in cell wall biosynthesis